MQLVEGTCVKIRVKSKNLKFILVLLKYDVDLDTCYPSDVIRMENDENDTQIFVKM